MTEGQLFKQMAEQCALQAIYFRRRFNGLALMNVFNALWMVAAGAYVWQAVPMPTRLIGLALFVFAGMGLHLAHSTRRYGQRAFDDFMKLRSNNLRIATELETGAG